MKILESALNSIHKTVGRYPSETGGILLGSRRDMVIQKFIFDKNGSGSAAAYDPDVDFLNKIIKEEWAENNLELIGFVHSHPRGISRLSGDWGGNTGDLGYLKAIFQSIPALQSFLVPIVFSDYDKKGFDLIPYRAERNQVESYQREELSIINDKHYKPAEPLTEKLNTIKLLGAVDIDLMARSHVLCVGLGGAQSLCEDLVRSGIGEITIMDFDTIDSTNVTTQAYNPSEKGALKTKALKQRLQAVNPYIKINTLNGNFLEISESRIKELVSGVSLILMMTDNFYAQARGNRVALKYRIPAIHAMMYERGRCSEVFFSIPEVTPACFRCAMSSRYKAYLEEGYENDVQSNGSTVFHTRYLNSVIGMVSLAVLHHRTCGYEFSNWFGESWDRNLIQIRSHPGYESRLFNAVNGNSPLNHNFDSIWQKIEPEVYPVYERTCPDCEGRGHQYEHYIKINSTFVNKDQNPVNGNYEDQNKEDDKTLSDHKNPKPKENVSKY